MTSLQEAGFGASESLDEVFENFGPVDFVDVDAFIDSQFDRALGSEEEIFHSNPHLKTEDEDSKIAVEREDGSGSAMAATLKSFDFTYGSNTQIELDAGALLSPQEEAKCSGLICSRCREIMDKDDFEGCFASSKTTTTGEATSKGCAGGIALEGTQYSTIYAYILVKFKLSLIICVCSCLL